MLNEKIYTAQMEVQSFEKMHMKLKGLVEQYVFFLTGTRQNSEDVAQEVFIKLWINWKSIKAMSDEALKNYVFIIIRNYILNERRKGSGPTRRKFLIEYLKTCSGYYLHDDILVAEGIKQHYQAVDQLPKKERLVYLFHINDYNAGEIAMRLKRSRYTVHNQLSTSYKKVKSFLNKNFKWNLSEPGRRKCWKASLN